MSASWPDSKKTFTQIVDGTTYVESINVNTVYDEVEAIQTYIGASSETQSKNATLINAFRHMLDPVPDITLIDADTIEIEAKAIVMFDGNDYVIKRNSSTFQITLSGDLDTGAEAASTVYYVWLTGDGASTTYSAVFSASDTAPTGYTYYKLIGKVYNDASSDITGKRKVPFDRVKVVTGTYTGDGATSQSITGIGGEPIYVRIWQRQTTDNILSRFETADNIVDDNANGGAVMDDGGAPEFRDNRVISLDADGFTVDDDGGGIHPNTNGSVYNYMCIL